MPEGETESSLSAVPQNFSSPLPSPAGMLEPLVLDGKELPQVCVGAEGPEGPGCRVLFHVLPLEAGLTPDILIPPGELLGVTGRAEVREGTLQTRLSDRGSCEGCH